MNPPYDRGSAIVIEVEFKKQEPFIAALYFDPITPKITITDSLGTNKISDITLTKKTTGKWYYICQTLTSWNIGVYSVKVAASTDTYNDITINLENFELI